MRSINYPITHSVFMLLLSTCFTHAVFAQDATLEAPVEINIESTITGSQEQPRVITIVPWQDPPAGSVEIPLSSIEMLNQVDMMRMLDRDEFLREIHYHDQLDTGMELRDSQSSN